MKVLIPFIAFISISFEIFGNQNSGVLAFVENNESFVYQLDDSEKQLNEHVQKLKNYSETRTDFYTKLQGILELGFTVKTTEYGYNYLKFNAIADCEIIPNLRLGLGTGLRLYLDNHALFDTFAAYPVIPFFADFRMNFNNKATSPYLSLNVGYSFDASDNFKRLGLMLNPTVGLRFKKSFKSSTNVGIGYDMQSAEWYELNGSKKFAGAISINVGLCF